MTTLRLRVLGRPVAVELDDDDEARIRHQWSACLDDSDDEPAVETVRMSSDADPARRDYSLASQVTLAGILARSGELTMLHACGVADPATGRIAVLIAESGAGKTTAARTLAADGFAYVTDETVAFDDQRRITAYPKPLSVVIDPSDPHHKSQHSPADLGLAPAPPECTVGYFCLLQRDSHPRPPSLEEVALIDAILAIIPQSSALPRMTRPLTSLATHINETGGARRVRYSEIADTAELLREQFDKAGIVEPFESIPPVGELVIDDPASRLVTNPDHASWGATQAVVRVPYTDAIAVDDEILVLVGATPVRLAGVAATVWEAAEQPGRIDELVDICVRTFGEHPMANELVAEAIDLLLSHGVVRTLEAGAE